MDLGLGAVEAAMMKNSEAENDEFQIGNLL